MALDLETKVQNYSLKKKVLTIGALIGIFGLGSGYYFLPRILEDTIVTESGKEKIEDRGTSYVEEQNTITVDKHKRCLRGANLPEFYPGVHFRYISWHPSILGKCDYVIDYLVEDISNK